MDRTEVNASPVQKALQGIKKYKYVLLTALLGVLLLLLPQNEKAADSGSATPSAAENFDAKAAFAKYCDESLLINGRSLNSKRFGQIADYCGRGADLRLFAPYFRV